MSYNIQKSNGDTISVADGALNTSTSLNLVGKNYPSYGKYINQNYVWLMENFAKSSEPTNPLTGQLWYDSTGAGDLKVNTAGGWKTLGTTVSSATQPAANLTTTGTGWWDTINQQLRIYNGSSWALVGPQGTAGSGTAGTQLEQTTINGTSANVLVTYVNGLPIAVFSNAAGTTTGNIQTNFPTLVAGLTMSSTYNNVSATIVGGAASTTFNGTLYTNNIMPLGNANANIGSSTYQYNTIFAKATSAQYADLAEVYAADAEYAPGTVMTIGGSAEVTQENGIASDTVFGVVTTNPAYLMNSEAQGVAIALTGRVPVRVVGHVDKGARLVSAGSGLARAAHPEEITPFNVIGRALATYDGLTEGIVEAVVLINR